MSSLQSRRTAKRNEKVLRPVRPNAGIEAAYRAKLTALVDAMSACVVYWLRASYRANTPRMAHGETPADGLRRSIRKLAAQWTKRFDVASEQLATISGCRSKSGRAQHFARSCAMAASRSSSR